MANSGDFVIFTRGDGSKVAVQPLRVLFVSRGDHATIINFGAGTQLNVREDMDEVLAKLAGEELQPAE